MQRQSSYRGGIGHNKVKPKTAAIKRTRSKITQLNAVEDRNAADGDLSRMLQIGMYPFSASTGRAAGVAMLVNPFSRLTQAKPMWRDRWTAQFCAIEILNGDQTIAVCNVYAPRDPTARQQLFQLISHLQRQRHMILIGGDFNCTLNGEYDRSHHTNAFSS